MNTHTIYEITLIKNCSFWFRKEKTHTFVIETNKPLSLIELRAFLPEFQVFDVKKIRITHK